MLLPIKSREGLIVRHTTVNEDEKSDEEEQQTESNPIESDNEGDTSDQDLNLEYVVSNRIEFRE